MHIYMYIHIHIFTNIHIFTYMYIFIYLYIQGMGRRVAQRCADAGVALLRAQRTPCVLPRPASASHVLILSLPLRKHLGGVFGWVEYGVTRLMEQM